MLGDFKLWQWKVDLGQGQQDIVEMVFSFSGRERIFLNGKKLVDKFNYRLKRAYEIALSNGSSATIQVKVDWSNAGLPHVELVPKIAHSVVNTQGPFSSPNVKKELSSNEKILKTLGLVAIWGAVIALQGGAIPAGIAGGASVYTMRFTQDARLSFSKKCMYVVVTVLGSWLLTVLSIVLFALIISK